MEVSTVGRKTKPTAPKSDEELFVHRDKHCTVAEGFDGRLELSIDYGWSPSILHVLRRFDITSIDVTIWPTWKDQSLQFLRKLNGTRSLSISTMGWLRGKSSVGWKEVENLDNLEHLVVCCNQAEGDPQAIDFTKQKKLKSCYLTWETPWASVSKQARLQSIKIRDEQNKLTTLDLSALTKLKSLEFVGCFKLKKVQLADRAKIKNLALGGVPRLTIDWQRFGRDVETLEINGKVGFELAEIGKVIRLKTLALMNLKRLPSLSFLRTIKSLERVRLWGTKVSESDRAVLRQINRS